MTLGDEGFTVQDMPVLINYIMKLCIVIGIKHIVLILQLCFNYYNSPGVSTLLHIYYIN